jgi:Holliday junction resolvase RusA-like endonuclease
MRGDIDNRVKPILDALVKSGRVDDDRNVAELYVRKLRASDLVLVTVQEAA